MGGVMQGPDLRVQRMASLRFADVFRSEIDEARRAGYRLQISPQENAAIVRLVPATQRTIALTRANDAVAAEATVPFEGASEMLDAVRVAIAAVLQHVRDAAA